MQSLKLIDGDIQFDDFGELLLVEDTEELAQCCAISLGTRTGEWFLNPDLGIDFDLFTGKTVNEEEMRDELNRALLDDDRIDSVEEITFSIDLKARVMTVSFLAIGTNGEVVEQERVKIGVG
ncbi:DUF2634 domain-containing protein [Paenibacillus amylolyticus]|uniref:DUF2634 domain-containing protein n=1 Tax=Paenibacillus amylolyticus TaxID=1451 RepID=UPI00096CA285|nr:DUF2634 domain-containing protein [Paenibacillus amylolyticus]OMF01235.1 DUF2634 domain-containing protein [Paenibacillus amylolyticus]